MAGRRSPSPARWRLAGDVHASSLDPPIGIAPALGQVRAASNQIPGSPKRAPILSRPLGLWSVDWQRPSRGRVQKYGRPPTQANRRPMARPPRQPHGNPMQHPLQPPMGPILAKYSLTPESVYAPAESRNLTEPRGGGYNAYLRAMPPLND